MVELASRLPFSSRRAAAGLVWILLAIACVGLAIGCAVSTLFAQLTVQGVATGVVFGSLALALVLIYRATEVINFAQGEMAMACVYFAFQFMQWGLSYWSAFFVTLAVAFVFGVVTQQVVIRPVQHRSVIAVVIVTVGLFILIDGLVEWKWSANQRFMQAPFGNKVYHLGSVPIARQQIGTIAIVLVCVLALWSFFRFTKVGLGMRAGALRPASARLVGVRTNALLAVGWGLAAVLGAVAGLMTEPSQYVLSPTLMQPVLLYAFAAAVLGGLESPGGALVGGIALGVFLNLIGQYWPFVGSVLQLPVAFAALLVVLLVKPTGLFGHRSVRKV